MRRFIALKSLVPGETGEFRPILIGHSGIGGLIGHDIQPLAQSGGLQRRVIAHAGLDRGHSIAQRDIEPDKALREIRDDDPGKVLPIDNSGLKATVRSDLIGRWFQPEFMR